MAVQSSKSWHFDCSWPRRGIRRKVMSFARTKWAVQRRFAPFFVCFLRCGSSRLELRVVDISNGFSQLFWPTVDAHPNVRQLDPSLWVVCTHCSPCQMFHPVDYDPWWRFTPFHNSLNLCCSRNHLQEVDSLQKQLAYVNTTLANLQNRLHVLQAVQRTLPPEFTGNWHSQIHNSVLFKRISFFYIPFDSPWTALSKTF